MNIRPLRILLIFLILGGSFLGWRSYHYFFDMHQPILSIVGLKAGSYVANELNCTIVGSDSYKIANLSVWLDGKILVDCFKVNSRMVEHPFCIATKTLTNGLHTLKVEAINALYNKKSTRTECSFYVDNTPLQAALIRLDTDCKVFQGRTLHLQFQVNKDIDQARVHTLSHTYPAVREAKNSPIYEAFIPISCEESPSEHLARIEIIDHVGASSLLEAKFQIVAFPFKRQQLVHVDTAKLKVEKEVGLSEKMFEEELIQHARQSPPQKLWQGSFYPPIDIIMVSTEYGTIRTTKERGRYMHKAVDVINQPKSVVWATQDGVIVIKNRYEHSGNTVVIDHGCGILSLFFHLDTFADIAVGDRIKRGKPLGTLGETGYAKGYHLHWEMRINNEPVDPMQWIKPNF